MEQGRGAIEGVRSFVTQADSIYEYCSEGSHGTYRCEKFHALGVKPRWDFAKSKGLYSNCLRDHGGKLIHMVGQSMRKGVSRVLAS